MESPKVIHEVYKRIDHINDVAYERLFENYLQLQLKGSNKLIEIDSTDQESVLNKLNHGLPVPGMVYIFIHLDQDNMVQLENAKTGKEIIFHDYTPIVFCTSFNPITRLFKGINFNILPPSERLKLLEAYYQYYKSFFDKIEEKTEYNKIAVNITYVIASMLGKNPDIFKRFDRMYNALFEYGYRSYYLNNTRRFRMIEYEEWKYIPFVIPSQAFKKSNLETIYRTYWDNKQNLI